MMVIITRFEDLSNDIFLEILDYLEAGDIFFAFTSLNSRVSSILDSARLHVNIHSTHCRHQVEFLSNHLKSHCDQVVSLQIYDTIFNQRNVVAYLFSRYDFINLRSCIFHSVESSSYLENVFLKLSKITKIVQFCINQPISVEEDKLDKSHAHKLSQLILVDTPQTLHSAALTFHYNHSQMATTSIIRTNLTCLQIVLYDAPDDISIYSFIPVLRVHNALRSLSVTIRSSQQSGDIVTNVPGVPSINDDDLPILSSLKFFDFQVIRVSCNIQSMGLILRCMPNLHRFVFTYLFDLFTSPSTTDLMDGSNWHEILTSHTPHLKKFDFHMSLLTHGEPIDLDSILNSFKYFLNLYHQWDMCITRWQFMPRLLGVIMCPSEHINLWTFNYLDTGRKYAVGTTIISDTFDMRSTNVSSLTKCNHYASDKKIQFFANRNTTTTTPHLTTNLRFENVNYVVCHLELPTLPILSLLQNHLIWLKRIGSFFTINDNDSQEYVSIFSRFVNLNNINHVNFSRNNDITRPDVIEGVLLTCPNVVELTIDSSLFFSSKVLNNPALIHVFNQLMKLDIHTDDLYFPSKYASTIVEHFPSLKVIECEVYSIDSAIPIVDIFLGKLAKLQSIAIYFKHNSLLDNPFSRSYVIEKRRQSFHLNKSDENKIAVMVDHQQLRIRLR